MSIFVWWKYASWKYRLQAIAFLVALDLASHFGMALVDHAERRTVPPIPHGFVLERN